MASEDGKTVGSYKAKTRFAELIDRVAEGEEVTITRHGTAVARLVPVRPKSTPEQRRRAIEAIRTLAKGNRLGGLQIRDMKSEGRR